MGEILRWLSSINEARVAIQTPTDPKMAVVLELTVETAWSCRVCNPQIWAKWSSG
ncbi:MAG: hypothetical protein KOO62_03560 [candidate division Zixibacteria bacterium]|nr:hypothetical protein [candidate division Zixibacteria bacterium]